MRRKWKTAKILVSIGACLFIVILLMGIFSKDDGDADRTAAEQPAQDNPASSAISPPPAPISFAPLHFDSSGRLPTKFHGFQLGMSVEQATAHNSSLSGCNGKGMPPPSDPNQSLCVHLSDGFFVTLTFLQGRLIDLGAHVEEISPEDAALFTTDTWNQLGKPSVDVYKGPSANEWVWIDGDVRIQFTGSKSGSFLGIKGSHGVTLDMAIYPILIKSIDADINKNNDLVMKHDFLMQVRRDWGEDFEQPILKPLPISLVDIQLRMTPWQVRSALPGIEISSSSEHEAQGKLTTSTVESYVDFWDGHVSKITRIRHDIPARQLTAMRERMIEDYGTPSSWFPGASLEDIRWEDNKTELACMLIKQGANSPEVDVSIEDKELESLKTEAQIAADPPKFNPAPETHSFF